MRERWEREIKIVEVYVFEIEREILQYSTLMVLQTAIGAHTLTYAHTPTHTHHRSLVSPVDAVSVITLDAT